MALLGMCLAVSSYTISTSEASPAPEQVTPGAPSAAGTTTVQSAPGPQSQLVPFWNPFWPFYYSYYSYAPYYYYYYYYYYPYFFYYYY